MKRRVVITGLGLVTPLGIGTEATWDRVISGKSGIGPITRFDAERYSSRIAGEVRDFRAEDFVSKRDVKKMDLFIKYAVAAAQFAMEDSSRQFMNFFEATLGRATVEFIRLQP